MSLSAPAVNPAKPVLVEQKVYDGAKRPSADASPAASSAAGNAGPELGAGAGAAEAMLLGSVAVRALAVMFARQLAELPAGAPLLLCTAATGPDFQPLLAFELQHAAMKRSIDGAIAATPPALAARSLSASLTTAGLGLDVLGKALGIFGADYRFEGIAVDSTDAMLVAALAEQMCRLGRSVKVLAAFPPAVGELPAALLQAFDDPFLWSQEAREQERRHTRALLDIERKVLALQGIAADPATPQEDAANARADAKALQSDADQATSVVNTWKTLADRLDAWTLRLTTADDRGALPLARAAQLAGLRHAMNEGAVLVVVQLHKVAGAAYTKRDLWSTLFGFTPFHVMGGATASLTAYDGTTGKVLCASHLPWHGGYRAVTEMQNLVNGAACMVARPPNATGGLL